MYKRQIYNLGEALTRLGITPEDYRAAAEINARREQLAEDEEEYDEEEYGFSDASVEPAEDNPTNGFDTWGYETYDGRFGDTPFYRSR